MQLHGLNLLKKECAKVKLFNNASSTADIMMWKEMIKNVGWHSV
jgi:hypothetical protein